MVVSDPMSLPGKRARHLPFPCKEIPSRKFFLRENAIILFLQHNTEMNIKESN